MDIGWAHSIELGLPFSEYERLGAGCVVWRHEFDYIAPILLGEEVAVATWIAENDGRVRVTRDFEMRRVADGNVVFRGRTRFVSVDMQTGRPTRMPPEFIERYKVQE